MRTIPDADHDRIPAIEADHLRLIATPSTTAATIARAQLQIAYSDIAKAWHLIFAGDSDEAMQCIAEARDELEAAQNMLSGRVWSLAP